jgi:hypothetical protein
VCWAACSRATYRFDPFGAMDVVPIATRCDPHRDPAGRASHLVVLNSLMHAAWPCLEDTEVRDDVNMFNKPKKLSKKKEKLRLAADKPADPRFYESVDFSPHKAPERSLTLSFRRLPVRDGSSVNAGALVVRGQLWKWKDQDGTPFAPGRIVAATTLPGWVRVHWFVTGETNGYRMGGDASDLALVEANPECSAYELLVPAFLRSPAPVVAAASTSAARGIVRVIAPLRRSRAAAEEPASLEQALRASLEDSRPPPPEAAEAASLEQALRASLEECEIRKLYEANRSLAKERDEAKKETLLLREQLRSTEGVVAELMSTKSIAASDQEALVALLHSMVEGAVAANRPPRECVVCLDLSASIACVPCGHLCVCLGDADKLHDECPVCRSHIDSTLRVFM